MNVANFSKFFFYVLMNISKQINETINTYREQFKALIKKNFMSPFYGWGSTVSRLVPLRGRSLLFTTKFQDIPGTRCIDLGRMKGLVDLGTTQWF